MKIKYKQEDGQRNRWIIEDDNGQEIPWVQSIQIEASVDSLVRITMECRPKDLELDLDIPTERVDWVEKT